MNDIDSGGEGGEEDRTGGKSERLEVNWDCDEEEGGERERRREGIRS